jgi:hypothetical protein
MTSMFLNWGRPPLHQQELTTTCQLLGVIPAGTHTLFLSLSRTNTHMHRHTHNHTH